MSIESIAKELEGETKEYIIAQVQSEGKKWKRIANQLESRFGMRIEFKKLAEIYENYLDPTSSFTPWTANEEFLLVKKFWELYKDESYSIGSIFKQIRELHFPNRRRNDIKNRYYTKMKEYLRKINKSSVSAACIPHMKDYLRYARLLVAEYNSKGFSPRTYLSKIIPRLAQNLCPRSSPRGLQTGCSKDQEVPVPLQLPLIRPISHIQNLSVQTQKRADPPLEIITGGKSVKEHSSQQTSLSGEGWGSSGVTLPFPECMRSKGGNSCPLEKNIQKNIHPLEYTSEVRNSIFVPQLLPPSYMPRVSNYPAVMQPQLPKGGISTLPTPLLNPMPLPSSMLCCYYYNQNPYSIPQTQMQTMLNLYPAPQMNNQSYSHPLNYPAQDK